MRFYSTDKQPPSTAELVCRQSAAVSSLGAFLILGLLGAVPMWLWFSGTLPTVIAVGLGLLNLLIVPIVTSSVWAAFLSSNWVLALAHDGVWLNLRSYQNHQLEPGTTVVHLTYHELAYARKHTARRSEATSDGTMRWKEQMLDLALAEDDGSLLAERIAEDRARKTTQKLLGGLITVTGQAKHVTIGVPEPGLIRIVWRSRYDFVRPGISSVLDRFARRIGVLENDVHVEPDWHDLPEDQVDSQVLALVERGNRIAAIKLLKLRRGYSLEDAKTFVDQLTGRLSSC